MQAQQVLKRRQALLQFSSGTWQYILDAIDSLAVCVCQLHA